MSNVSMIDGHIDGSKLTDNEIIKALECCTKPEVGKKCPRARGNNLCNDICVEFLLHDTLDLINRLKADKEALIKGLETLMKCISKKKEIIAELDNEVEELKNALKKGCELSRCINKGWIKSEAVKEFADTVYSFFCQTSNWNNLKDAILFNGECDWLKENLENLVEIRVGGEADV